MKRLIWIALFSCMTSAIFAQETRVLFGRLTVFNEYPVANVNISAKKAGTSVTTDEFGEFTIVIQQKDILQIKAGVFESVSKRINDETEFLEMNLVFRDTKKNRELATGLGYVTQEQLSYGLAHMSNENNDFCNYDNIFTLIQSKFPGVAVRADSQGGWRVYVRGQKSITQDTPALYVVNGIMYDDLPELTPCDLSSLNIIKEGGSSLYGMRGAYGVVVIETKK